MLPLLGSKAERLPPAPSPKLLQNQRHLCVKLKEAVYGVISRTAAIGMRTADRRASSGTSALDVISLAWRAPIWSCPDWDRPGFCIEVRGKQLQVNLPPPLLVFACTFSPLLRGILLQRSLRWQNNPCNLNSLFSFGKKKPLWATPAGTYKVQNALVTD